MTGAGIQSDQGGNSQHAADAATGNGSDRGVKIAPMISATAPPGTRLLRRTAFEQARAARQASVRTLLC